MDFTTWTRQDFLAFDQRRSEVFQPTPEELEQQKAERDAYVKATVSAKLSAIGMQMPETITKDFAIEVLTAVNAKVFVGEDYSGWVDSQVAIFGDIETAFNQIILNYLNV